MRLTTLYPYQRGGCFFDGAVKGVISFELHHNSRTQTFRGTHFEPIKGQTLREARYQCKMNLITKTLPNLIGDLTKQIEYGKLWPNDTKKPEDITEDYTLE